MELKTAFEMGKDYAKNGADEINCNFRCFATKELLDAWTKGKNVE